MDIKTFLLDWIASCNNYNTENYLDKYHEDAVLEDPSVGKTFVGHKGIRDYYTSYFIDYKTQTKVLKLTSQNNKAHLEVEFTGEFPERKLRGMFDFNFKNGRISKVKADLM